MIPTLHNEWQLIQVRRSSASKQTSNMQMHRALLFRTSSERIQATLCRTELLRGRDGQMPNLMSSKHWRCWDETAWLELISSQNNWWITWWKSSVPRNLTKFSAINCTNITPFIRGSQTSSQILVSTCPTAFLTKTILFLIFLVGNITLGWQIHLVNT